MQHYSHRKNTPLINSHFSWCNYIAIVKKLDNFHWKDCQKGTVCFFFQCSVRCISCLIPLGWQLNKSWINYFYLPFIKKALQCISHENSQMWWLRALQITLWSLRLLGPTYMVRNLEIPFRVTREILNMSLLYRFINRGACLPDSQSVLLSTRPSWKWLPGLKASRLNGDYQSGYFQIRILIRRQ